MTRTALAGVLALLMLLSWAPAAVGAEAATLGDFEEVHEGTDVVLPFVVTEDEAGEMRALVFRNQPGNVFGLVIYDSTGDEVYAKNGTRGLQTLPPMAEGKYRFFIRGTGAFQVTDKFLDLVGKPGIERVLNVSTTLNGTDAYALAPSTNWTIDFTGDVEIEWFELIGGATRLAPPVNMTAVYGNPYVITIRGEDGTPYTIGFTETAGPRAPTTTNESPGPAPLLVALAVAGAAGAFARLTRKT